MHRRGGVAEKSEDERCRPRLAPAPDPHLHGDDDERELRRGRDRGRALLRDDGVGEHLPPRALVAAEAVGGGWPEPPREGVREGAADAAHRARVPTLAHHAPIANRAGIAHAHARPPAQAPHVHPLLRARARARRDEEVVAEARPRAKEFRRENARQTRDAREKKPPPPSRTRERLPGRRRDASRAAPVPVLVLRPPSPSSSPPSSSPTRQNRHTRGGAPARSPSLPRARRASSAAVLGVAQGCDATASSASAFAARAERTRWRRSESSSDGGGGGVRGERRAGGGHGRHETETSAAAGRREDEDEARDASSRDDVADPLVRGAEVGLRSSGPPSRERRRCIASRMRSPSTERHPGGRASDASNKAPRRARDSKSPSPETDARQGSLGRKRRERPSYGRSRSRSLHVVSRADEVEGEAEDDAKRLRGERAREDPRRSSSAAHFELSASWAASARGDRFNGSKPRATGTISGNRQAAAVRSGEVELLPRRFRRRGKEGERGGSAGRTTTPGGGGGRPGRARGGRRGRRAGQVSERRARAACRASARSFGAGCRPRRGRGGEGAGRDARGRGWGQMGRRTGGARVG